MKNVLLITISIFLFIIDISCMPFFNVYGVYPSLLNIYFFIYCMNMEKYEIFYFSVIIGFLQDIFFYNGFGVNVLLNIILGIIFYYVSMKYNKNKYLLSIFIVSSLSVIKSFLINVFLKISFGMDMNILGLFYELIYSIFVSIFIYAVLDKFFKSKLFKKTLEF